MKKIFQDRDNWHQIYELDNGFTGYKLKPGIAALLFKDTDKGREFCIRHEVNSLLNKKSYSTITGRMDPGEQPDETAIREVYEESGAIPGTFTCYYAGKIHLGKGQLNYEYFYVVDCTNADWVEPETDGSLDEKNSENIFYSKNEFLSILANSTCAILHTAWARYEILKMQGLI